MHEEIKKTAAAKTLKNNQWQLKVTLTLHVSGSVLTLSPKTSLHCWMLHVASTPCCMLLRAGRSCCAKFETGCVALRVAQIVNFKIELLSSRLSPMTCTEAPLLIAYSNVVFTGNFTITSYPLAKPCRTTIKLQLRATDNQRMECMIN